MASFFPDTVYVYLFVFNPCGYYTQRNNNNQIKHRKPNIVTHIQCRLKALVVSTDAMNAVCTCRRLPSCQSVYQFQFITPPSLNVILTSDSLNLVVSTSKLAKHQQYSSSVTSSDEVMPASATTDNELFIIRQVNAGNIVTKAKPTYPEYRYEAVHFCDVLLRT